MKTTTIRFSDEEYEALSAVAKRKERSQNDIVRNALLLDPDIQQYLKNKQAQKSQEQVT